MHTRSFIAVSSTVLLFLFLNSGIIAQGVNEFNDGKIFPFKPSAYIIPGQITYSAMPVENESADKEKLAGIKRKKNAVKEGMYLNTQDYYRKAEDAPFAFRKFKARVSIHDTPPDNTLAVSDDGYIVMCINSYIEYYTLDGERLYGASFRDFFSNPELSGILYDPNLIYDPVARRFILVLLHGNHSSNSALVLAFSKSGNPMDGWNFYTMNFREIDPWVYNNKWIDFPRIGLSDRELFITANIFYDNEGGFYKPIIFQLNKSDGYEGKAIRRKIWTDIRMPDNSVPFSLTPATYGKKGLIGPNMYFVATRHQGGKEIDLLEITNSMENQPQIKSYILATEPYEPGGDARQKSPSGKDPGLMLTGDSRITNAFWYNDHIHFVFSADAGDGFCGIYYYRLNTKKLSLQKCVISESGVDLAYPSVVSSSQENLKDHSVIIAYLKSSENIYPSFAAVSVDGDMNISSEQLLFEGDDYVDILDNADERWGDYTTLQRQHNSSAPRIWAAGCIGTSYRDYSKNPPTIITHTYQTVIAEISTDLNNSRKDFLSHATAIKVSPNPVSGTSASVEFNITTPGNYELILCSLDGKLHYRLFGDYLQPGYFSFRLFENQEMSIPDGLYLLSLRKDGEPLDYIKMLIK